MTAENNSNSKAAEWQRHTIKQNILNAVNEWLTPTFDKQTQEAVIEMMTSSPKDLEESFYKNLEF